MSKLDLNRFKQTFYHYISYVLGKKFDQASSVDLTNALAFAVRQQLVDIRFDTEERYKKKQVKCMYYVSMEFLIGRLLLNNLLNLGMLDECRQFLNEIGIELNDLLEEEKDPALGNGGLGRLAACFLDSLATMGMPGFGYGINYDYGLFKQIIVNGYQREKPDYWPNRFSPWLIRCSGSRFMIPIYGKIVETKDMNGEYNPEWRDWNLLIGRPHDILISGYGGQTVNRLRLFSAWASEDFDIHIFNDGDYFKAVEDKIKSESISKILYPSDSSEVGKELRLVQEYFLVACSVRDVVQSFEKMYTDFDQFPDKIAIQLNDTHPALTVAELMRILVDEKGIEWDGAWRITTATLGYTNHTLLPEALEKWPVSIVERVVPRHLQIIYEINRRFLKQIKDPDDPQAEDLLRQVSIIEEGELKQVRMAHLAIVGCHSVNGVAKVHSNLVKTQLVPQFFSLFPQRFNNKTNGVTPRRWLAACNPGLKGLISETIGESWLTDFSRIKALKPYCSDAAFLERFRTIKRENKAHLAGEIKKSVFESVDPDSIFDIHAKRIHEYKRQLLNILNIINLYLQIKDEKKDTGHPRTFIFAGKAAPGYAIAKLIIKLIHSVGQVINKDPQVNQSIKVVFMPDYRVTLAEILIPAADVSEQISTAGMEASGTGNMKFAMNGAVTIGTLDGANIEISEHVGNGNIYIFGLTVDQVKQCRTAYKPNDLADSDERIQNVVQAIVSDRFCKKEPGLFKGIADLLMNPSDPYLHLADFGSYAAEHEKIGTDYMDKNGWARKMVLNTAGTGWFSSDRTIAEYASDIWNIKSQI